MIRVFVILSVVLVSVFFVADTFAQNQSAEFIESSSPLPGGGKVVSRSSPGMDMQTVASKPNQPTDPLGQLANASSAKQTQPTSARNSVFRPSQVAPVVNSQTPRYSYPASGWLPRSNVTGQTALFYQPVRATATCNNCPLPYQIPSLGLNNTVQTGRQSYGPARNTVLQVTGAQVPALQIQPPANQVPGLESGLNPTVVQPNAIQPNANVGLPSVNPPQNRFINPLVTGSGAYQPIIRIANVPPGTYVGQGIIGQPVAYVDGQPVRNLFRYVFP